MRATGIAVILSAVLLAPVQARDAFYPAPIDEAVPAPSIVPEQPEDLLQPGQFDWPAAAPGAGPILIVISLGEQRAYVYRDGQRLAVSTISSGKPGTETPTGVYAILQKERIHHSNRYDNAPMPFMQRLSWDGLALHAGVLPGHPASHGCIRLPREFARRLFQITRYGETVVVSEDRSVDALIRVGLPKPLALMVGMPPRPPEDVLSVE